VRFPSWLVGIPFALLIAWFAVSNRSLIQLELWPIPGSVEIPIYLAVLTALLVGFVMGALAAIASAIGRRATGRGRR
jgi:uncharacterized integral membrane protein